MTAAATAWLAAALIALAAACGQAPAEPAPEPAAEPTPTPAPTQVPTATSVPPAPEPTAEPTPAPAPTRIPAATPAPEPAADDSPEDPDQPDGLPSIADLVERVRPSVVAITTEAPRRGVLGSYMAEGAGSGIIIRPEGLIATNAHVVGGSEGIRVYLDGGASYDAEIVGRDVISDLAILRIDAEGLPHLVPSGSESLRVGDWVLALGNAAGLRGGPTVTLGIVSGRDRAIATELGQLYDLIQTDAAINHGNSGGPLIDLEGNVVGITTAMMRQAQGIGFAVSSSVAVPILDSLIDSGRYVRPLIGVTGMDAGPDLGLGAHPGVLVTTMPLDGPAYLAGIRVGDVITALGGVETPDMPTFLSELWAHRPGDELSVSYVSDGEAATVVVTLVERPQ